MLMISDTDPFAVFYSDVDAYLDPTFNMIWFSFYIIWIPLDAIRIRIPRMMRIRISNTVSYMIDIPNRYCVHRLLNFYLG
jgi:hypothetical protein